MTLDFDFHRTLRTLFQDMSTLESRFRNVIAGFRADRVRLLTELAAESDAHQFTRQQLLEALAKPPASSEEIESAKADLEAAQLELDAANERLIAAQNEIARMFRLIQTDEMQDAELESIVQEGESYLAEFAPDLPAPETQPPAIGELPEEPDEDEVTFVPEPEPEAPIEEPVVETPVVETPVVEEPAPEAPIEEPVVETPVVEEPVAEAPVIEEPVAEAPVIEEPVIEEPVAEAPVIEEPVIEEPVAELPAEVPAEEPSTLPPADEPPPVLSF